MNDTLKTTLVAGLSALSGGLLVLLLAGDKIPSMPAVTDSRAVDELRERVAELESRLASAGPRGGPSTGTAAQEAVDAAANQAEAEETPREQRSADRREQQLERLGTRLREAGWSDVEIDSLIELRTSAALEYEQQQYDAMRRRLREDPDQISLWRDRQSVMREALGDEKYEQYLKAAGRPVAVEIHNVPAGSAVETAGLKPGDQIRRYGTTRIFDDMDLMLASLDGEPGDSVSIEVERDGTTFHVTVPRGPLGVSRFARFGRGF